MAHGKTREETQFVRAKVARKGLRSLETFLRGARNSHPASHGSLTETSQTHYGLQIHLGFFRKARIAMGVHLPAHLGLAPRNAGLWVVRASILEPKTMPTLSIEKTKTGSTNCSTCAVACFSTP
jgi:hypothetical protein